MQSFIKAGTTVVYPSHGIGKILKVQQQDIGEVAIDVILVEFPDDRLTLTIPMVKAQKSGLRPLVSMDIMDQSLEILKLKSKPPVMPWNRRVTFYEQKLNSGDPKALAEVVRDLKLELNQNDTSYAKMNLYRRALHRLSQELSLVRGMTQEEATKTIES